MNPHTIETACNEACRDVSLLVRSRKESGRPLPTSEVLAVAFGGVLCLPVGLSLGVDAALALCYSGFVTRVTTTYHQ